MASVYLWEKENDYIAIYCMIEFCVKSLLPLAFVEIIMLLLWFIS